MKYSQEIKVYYADTDTYGIVWHGAYIKWFEIGRVELSNLLGIDFTELEKEGIQMPVVELNCRYKSPARLFDDLVIVTELGQINRASFTFNHNIYNKTATKSVLSAYSTVVITDINGKLFRKIPENILEKFTKTSENVLC
jgi:acyl-CoA thioester hydrolase